MSYDFERGEAMEAQHYKRDRHAKPPPNRAEDAKRRVGRWTTQTCSWCGGSGYDPSFGGSSDTCQTCGGQGVEEVQT